MNIIIVGAGEIGHHFALSLSNKGHNITVIEQNDKLAKEIEENDEVDTVIPGNGTHPNLLIDEANISQCDLFFALTSDDTANLTACKVANEGGAKTTICRVSEALRRNEFPLRLDQLFSVDHMFSSEQLCATQLSKSIHNPVPTEIEEIGLGKIEVQQVIVTGGSDACNQSLREIALPERIRVLSILRAKGGMAFIAGPDDYLQEGDRVTLCGNPQTLAETANKLHAGNMKDWKPRIVIVGGGSYGFALAKKMEAWNYKVRVFERDQAHAEKIAGELDDSINIINADATLLKNLQEEQIGEVEVDFFIATTRNDIDNLVSCLHAKKLKTKQCLTLTHHTDHADVLRLAHQQLGIDSVSPREVVQQELMRFITSDKYHVIKDLPGGELIEVTVRENSKADGATVKDMKIDNCSLVAHINENHTRVPSSEDLISAGDNLYALVSKKARKEFIKLVTK
jgi:trk system potassium uptake protein TrkA